MADVKQTTECVIRVGDLYWRDYASYGGWPWTQDIELAAKFNHAIANGIIAHWTKYHHAASFKPDGSVLTPATSLGGILPLNAGIENVTNDDQ